MKYKISAFLAAFVFLMPQCVMALVTDADKVEIAEQTDNAGLPDATAGRSDAVFRPGKDRTSLNVYESSRGSLDIVIRGFMFGFVNGSGTSAPVNIDMGRSFELAALQPVGIRFASPSGNTAVSVGVGFGWRNYKMDGARVRFVSDGYGHLSTGAYPADVNPRFSRIKVFSLSVPFLYEQCLPFKVPGKAKFSVTAGIVLNYNAHASVKTEWIDTEGNRVEESCNSIGHRKFTVDFIGIARFCKFAGLYVKYSPQTVLCGNAGPRFRSFSTGIICFY